MSIGFLRTLVAAAAFAAGTALAAGPSQAQVERLTDLVVQAMPFGKIFDKVQARDPKWPLGDKAGKATGAQLACLRSELSSAGYRRNKLKDVTAYARAHPERVADDIRLLEAGAAELFGKFVLAGAEAEASGKPADTDAILASASAADGVALTSLASDAGNANLRVLIGMGGMFEQAASASDQDMRNRGEQQGVQLGTRLMLDALDTCGLPMSALQ